MNSLIAIYYPAIYALGAIGSLLVFQLLTADFTGIKLGHIPGSTVESNHDNFIFRASRAVANTNESIAAFILAILFCIFMGASPTFTNTFAWLYAFARVAYMLCYYLNLQKLRSISFGISLIAIIALLITGFMT